MELKKLNKIELNTKLTYKNINKLILSDINTNILAQELQKYIPIISRHEVEDNQELLYTIKTLQTNDCIITLIYKQGVCNDIEIEKI